MNAYRRVVVATDFSSGSRAVLGAVEALAGKEPIAVHLVHAMEPLPAFVPSPVPLAEQPALERRARGELERMAEALRKRLGRAVDVDATVTTGPADLGIRRLADRTRAHLIIVGTHGRTGLRRAVMGSVAERVVRFAKRPVLVVPLAGTHRSGRASRPRPTAPSRRATRAATR